MHSSTKAKRGTLAFAVVLFASIMITGSAFAQDEGDPLDPNGEGDVAPDGEDGDGDTAPDPDAAGDGDGDTAPDPDAAGDGADEDGEDGDVDPDSVNTDEMPVNLRLRRLEQRVQALKERAWRAKARVGMLKEAVLGGGVGAQATVVHKNKMGNSFRLIKLVYALDGTQIFARADDTGSMHKTKDFDILTGPIAPGSHTISVLALYRGHGYGVFKYLTKYKFTVRSSHTFTAVEGKATRIEAVAFERGGVTTPLEKRPAIDFKVSHSDGTGGGE